MNRLAIYALPEQRSFVVGHGVEERETEGSVWGHGLLVHQRFGVGWRWGFVAPAAVVVSVMPMVMPPTIPFLIVF